MPFGSSCTRRCGARISWGFSGYLAFQSCRLEGRELFEHAAQVLSRIFRCDPLLMMHMRMDPCAGRSGVVTVIIDRAVHLTSAMAVAACETRSTTPSIRLACARRREAPHQYLPNRTTVGSSSSAPPYAYIDPFARDRSQ